jgi:hypothetical protein
MEKDLSQRIKFPPKAMEALKPKARKKAKETKASYQARSKPTIGKRRQREETSAPSNVSSKKPKTDKDLNIISDTDTWKDSPTADNTATNESSSESQTLPLPPPPPPEREDGISTFEDAVLAMKKRQRKREEELEQHALKMLSVTAICDGDDPDVPHLHANIRLESAGELYRRRIALWLCNK